MKTSPYDVRDLFVTIELIIFSFLAHSNVDYYCLRIYNEENEHFSMAIIMEKQEEEEQEHAIGYDCIYRYGLHRIQLQFDIKNGLWKVIPVESDQEEEARSLESIFDDVQFFTLDRQVQIIIKRLDQHFHRECKLRYSSSIEISISIFKEENAIELLNHEPVQFISHQASTSLTIPEDDEQQKDIVDYGFHSIISGSRPKFTGLAPPPVAPRRSRQNSACSTQSSVRYAS